MTTWCAGMGAYSSSFAMGGKDIYDDNEKKRNVKVYTSKFTQNILILILFTYTYFYTVYVFTGNFCLV